MFILDWLPMLDSLSGVLRVDSSAGSARRCTGRGWCYWPWSHALSQRKKLSFSLFADFSQLIVYVFVGSSALHWATESRNLLEQTPNVWIIKYDTCPIFHPELTPKAGQHVRHSQVDSSAGSSRCCTQRAWPCWPWCHASLWKRNNRLKKMHQMAQFSFIYGIKKAGLWKFFCLEMSENICFIFGITKAGLWTFFRPWNV